jgi:hypothetical protein
MPTQDRENGEHVFRKAFGSADLAPHAHAAQEQQPETLQHRTQRLRKLRLQKEAADRGLPMEPEPGIDLKAAELRAAKAKRKRKRRRG